MTGSANTNGAHTSANWRSIVDVPVAALGHQEASALIRETVASRGFMRINFLNANNANIAAGDEALREALGGSLVLSDGIGLDLASRMLYGAPFPANLNGTDFIPRLLAETSAPMIVGLVGATADALAAAAAQFAIIAPQHRFVAISDGYFTDDAATAAKIRVVRPDLLLVGMGTPRQEIWSARHVGESDCSVVVTVGALFDFIAMRVPRAPLFMRRWKVEWLFRLALEPRRLARRYLLGNPLFLYRALRQKLAGRARAGHAPNS
jgi:exopolysaccharide biosynthesis WecB/TagA/CpsF family protein